MQIRGDEGRWTVTSPEGRNGIYVFVFIVREFLLEVKRDRSKLLHTEESGGTWRDFSLGIKMEDN